MPELITQIIELASLLVPGKSLIIYGPRRAGKTTLLKTYDTFATNVFISIDASRAA